jgi:hypothetical protein
VASQEEEAERANKEISEVNAEPLYDVEQAKGSFSHFRVVI